MDFVFNEGIGLKMFVIAGSSQLLSQLGRALDRNLGSEVEDSKELQRSGRGAVSQDRRLCKAF